MAPVTHNIDSFPLQQWQEWASPVWMSIDQTNVLNVSQARTDRDEKHMCPLQLDLIERSVRLWSNPGDVVFSPFAGIGSEGYKALQLDRRFAGIELKPEYWRIGVGNLRAAAAQQTLHLVNARGSAWTASAGDRSTSAGRILGATCASVLEDSDDEDVRGNAKDITGCDV
mgnify:FL=1